jgi:hypothetical protein
MESVGTGSHLEVRRLVRIATLFIAIVSGVAAIAGTAGPACGWLRSWLAVHGAVNIAGLLAAKMSKRHRPVYRAACLAWVVFTTLWGVYGVDCVASSAHCRHRSFLWYLAVATLCSKVITVWTIWSLVMRAR